MSSAIGSTDSAATSVAAQQYAQQLAALQAQYAGSAGTEAIADDPTAMQALPGMAAMQPSMQGLGGRHQLHHGGDTCFDRGVPGGSGGADMDDADGPRASGGYGAYARWGAAQGYGMQGPGRGDRSGGMHRSEGGGAFGSRQVDPQAFADRLMQRFDADGNNSISEGELVAGLQRLQSGAQNGDSTAFETVNPGKVPAPDGFDSSGILSDGTTPAVSDDTTAPTSLPDDSAVAESSMGAATLGSSVISDPTLSYADPASVYAAMAASGEDADGQVAA